jgi:hypothetical protein
MSTSIWTRLAMVGLAACTVAALAAPASGQDLRRDGSKAVPFVADVSRPAGPTADDPVLRRDGSEAVPLVADLQPDVAAPAADGFDWGDAAVGAGAAIGLAALGGAGLALRGRRAPARAPVHQRKATAT